MRFSKNAKINANLKITFKSFLVFLIVFSFALDLGNYISGVSKKGFIFDWNGELAIYSKDAVGMLISNYFFTFSTILNVVTVFYLLFAIFSHREESRHWFQNYPVGLFLVLSYLFSMFSYLFFVLPTANHIETLTWVSNSITKFIVPILMFVYVMILMENKSWYGVKESIVRYGVKIFFTYLLIIFFYYLIWLSKFNHELDLYNYNYKKIVEDFINPSTSDGFDKPKILIDVESLKSVWNYVPTWWSNHDVIIGERLFHFSNDAKFFSFGIHEWLGPIFALIFFVILSFGFVPLMAMLNIAIVSSPKYVVIQKTHLSHPQVIDLRDDADSLEISQEIEEF